MAAPELSFPIDVPGGNEGLAATHQRLELTPLGDKAAEYSIVLPKGWKVESDLGAQSDAFGHAMRIGVFADRIGPDAAAVQLTMTNLPCEVDLLDWVRYQADLFGLRLVMARPFEFFDGRVGVDSGGWYGPQDNLHVVRQSTFADSGRIFHAVAMVRAQRYPEVIRDVTIALQSFRLVQPAPTPQLEQWLAVTVPAAPAFRVAMPMTWRARVVDSTTPGKSGIDLVLMSDAGMQSYLRIKAIDPKVAGDRPTAELLRIAEEELGESTIPIRLVAPWAVEGEPSAGEAVTGLYRADGKLGKNEDVELRCGLVRRDPWQFVLTLLTVRRTDNPILWMRGRRAYEIALSSIEPLPAEAVNGVDPSAN